MNADGQIPASLYRRGLKIPVRYWPASGSPRAVVQVLHGLAEHAGRYARFAGVLNAAGISVVSHDHRGHGAEHYEPRGHFADTEGWTVLIEDAGTVRDTIDAQLPGVPHVLLGHSMGSYIAQSFAMRYPEKVQRLILSGSTSPNRVEVRAARSIAWLLSTIFGARSTGNFLNKASFGEFNDDFKPNRTEFDWLSRDEAEVDAYIEDPLCGGISSNRLWYDLLGGLLVISAPGALEQLPEELPVLILGGALDPVGGASGLSRLARQYGKAGHTQVTLQLYQDGRHEMLNETNRDEVTADILTWIESTL